MPTATAIPETPSLFAFDAETLPLKGSLWLMDTEWTRWSVLSLNCHLWSVYGDRTFNPGVDRRGWTGYLRQCNFSRFVTHLTYPDFRKCLVCHHGKSHSALNCVAGQDPKQIWECWTKQWTRIWSMKCGQYPKIGEFKKWKFSFFGRK